MRQRNEINTNSMQEEEKMNIDAPSTQDLITMDQLKKMVYNTNIMVHYKNTVLKDDFTVAEYHIEENSQLLI